MDLTLDIVKIDKIFKIVYLICVICMNMYSIIQSCDSITMYNSMQIHIKSFR